MPGPEQLHRDDDAGPLANPAVWCTGMLLATAFFFAEHSVTTSLKLAFTLSAEEMVSEAGGGNVWRRVAFLGLAAAGAITLFLRTPLRWKYPNLITMGIVLLLGHCGLSVLWSVDADVTLRRLFVLGLATMAATGLGVRFSYRDLCAIALIAAGSLVINGVVCELGLGTFRPWSPEYRFSGSLHPNTQGVYLATVLFAALVLGRCDAPRVNWYRAISVAAMILLLLTKSRTSTAGVMVVWSLTWLSLQHPVWRFVLPAGGAWLLGSGLLVCLLCGADIDRQLAKLAFMGREEQTESFSGRTIIWPVVNGYIQQRYWVGHGYDSFWTAETIEEVTRECQWPVREAHSAYYETLLHLGAVGLTLLLAVVVSGIVLSYAQYWQSHNPALLFWTAMLLNGLFNGLFESGMVMITLPTLLIATGLARLSLIRETAALARPRPALTFPAPAAARGFAT